MRRILTFAKKSLPAQILIAAILGVIAGHWISVRFAPGLGEIGKAVIHWVKLIAGPFLFFTIVQAVLRVELAWSHGLRLIAIALFNTSIAVGIGIGLALLFLEGHTLQLATEGADAITAPAGVRLDFSSWLHTFMPKSLFEPFVKNEILLIALLALLTGIAVRRSGAFDEKALARFSQALERARATISILLGWLVQVIPLAVFAVLASTVAINGLSVFGPLASFVGVAILGFLLQCGLVYGTWIFLIAKIRPQAFWREAREPVLYAGGVNSSLATLPLTLTALKRLGVSDRSASLGAGVATNLNNDGIVLYEGMAIFFVAFTSGIPMEPVQMIVAALACIIASMGITGIPEAGFISLSVVIGTLGLPLELLPLLLSVDWILGRFRSMVNVLSDMTLSIAMDVTEPTMKNLQRDV